jgi:hypothetical protein
VKVLDFGLARSAAGDEPHLTQTGAVVGTPAYMAPEQARGEVPDQRSDLFSLGCVLYQMTTGRTPFTGPTAMAILTSLAMDRPPAPWELNPVPPSGLSELIMRLLAKDPGGRPPSAWAVVAELQDIERGLRAEASLRTTTESPAASAAPGLAPSSRRTGRGRRVLAAVAVLGVAACLVAAIIVIIRDKQGKEVGRVVVPEGGSVDVRPDDAEKKEEPGAPKEPVRPALADRDKPFVLVQADGRREEFKQAGDALAVLQDGDAIEVYGNGPFTLPQVQLDGKGLTLQAGPGYRPCFFPRAPCRRADHGSRSTKRPSAWRAVTSICRLAGSSWAARSAGSSRAAEPGS